MSKGKKITDISEGHYQKRKCLFWILDWILDVIEIWYPALCLIILFVSFLIGIFSRYILKNPQSWTYELSTVCFVNMVVASWPYVQRKHGHIAFDMVYEKRPKNVQCLMRVAGNLLILLCSVILLPAVFSYLMGMKGLTTQIIHLPRWLVFTCFAFSFLLSAIRSIIDIVTDLKSRTIWEEHQ